MFCANKKPTASRFWWWVSVFLRITLFHPFPASRRHVIRVDMPVPVDVIRFAFWMETLIDCAYRRTMNQSKLIPGRASREIQNSDATYRNSQQDRMTCLIAGISQVYFFKIGLYPSPISRVRIASASFTSEYGPTWTWKKLSILDCEATNAG